MFTDSFIIFTYFYFYLFIYLFFGVVESYFFWYLQENFFRIWHAAD